MVCRVNVDGPSVVIDCCLGDEVVSELLAGLREPERQPTWAAEQIKTANRAPVVCGGEWMAVEERRPPLTQVVACLLY